MFAGFELTTPVSNRPQTFALDRSATGINKIRTRNPSKRSAANFRLRLFGHWVSTRFEPEIPASDQQQTLALDRSATGIDKIRTRNPSKRSAANFRLRLFGHWVSTRFEPEIPASDQQQTLALDRSATGIDKIQTRNPSKRSTADPPLRPIGHPVRLL